MTGHISIHQRKQKKRAAIVLGTLRKIPKTPEKTACPARAAHSKRATANFAAAAKCTVREFPYRVGYT
jgi:hypothetical protein